METLSAEIEVCGENLTLLPGKLIWWAARRTLFVADTHFGKAATFRQAGIPVPVGTTNAMLRQLTQAIRAYHAGRLVILGDFVHSSTRCVNGFEAELIAWRETLRNLEIMLILGNHDRGHDKLFQAMDLKVVDEPYFEEPFAFCHNHNANQEDSFYALAGHVHPAIRLNTGRFDGKTACFLFSDDYALLPAFGEFTGTATVRSQNNDRVFVVSDAEVCDVTNLVACKR
jgi:DNA ligase-associated metallophosphoesterase